MIAEESPTTRIKSPPDAPRTENAASGSKSEEAAAPALVTPFYRKPIFIVALIVVLLLSVAGIFLWLHGRNFEETDDAFIDGHVIPITPQVAAIVSAVHISDNQLVHKGDLLLELDPTDFQVALEQSQGAEAAARGRLQQANAGIETARSAIVEAQAELDSNQVTFDNADRDLRRYLQLDDRAKSQQAQDNATAAQKTAQAQVEQSKAKLQSAQSQVISAQANVAAAEGDLKKAVADTRKAQVNLGYCKIYAPVDGRITTKNVDVGMYVTSANPMFQLVPSDVWVTANFKETQLDRMQPGQPVSLSIDAYPDKEFHGKVDSIQMGTGSRFSVIPAENATGNFVKVVQRVPVKIIFDSDPNGDPNHVLAPGMSVEPSVRVGDDGF